MYLRYAGIMTLAAIVAKLLLFLTDVGQQHMAIYTIMVNLLVILVGSFFAVRSFKIKHPDATIKEQVKNGMKTTTLFALFLSIFVLIYYKYIDTHYFQLMIQERVELAAQEKVNIPEIDLDQVRRTGEMLFSPKTHSTITLFGLSIVGAIYTLIIVYFMRRMPGFK